MKHVPEGPEQAPVDSCNQRADAGLRRQAGRVRGAMVAGFIADWPGKSALTEGGIAHPAAYHMLDVAAVAERPIAPFGLDTALREVLILLVALHDIGKVNAAFREMLNTGAAQVNGRHWEVTEVYLRRFNPLHALRSTRSAQLYAAAAGHHGRPPARALDRDADRMLVAAGAQGVQDASDLIMTMQALWPDAVRAEISKDAARDLSWWLPGLVAAADWIGSNPDWFEPAKPTLDLPAYLALARQRAAVAVQKAGLDSPGPGNATLFDFGLRPMQAACAGIGLSEGPMLAVIEDETGAGKTEAALILAQRMMVAGKGRGLFFALPTMATADAMFARACDVVGRMFLGKPSVTLAHGRAGLSVPFRDLVGKDRKDEGEIVCSAWLADGRRRALLADVGVGTIDQALLAVLPTKFATLRLFGLSSKILIVDEVHELGDPYLAVALKQLLEAHKRAGGSAILLTATLPLRQRAELLAIYGGANDDPAYPALTVARGEARRDFPQAVGARGPVRVERLGDAAAAVMLLAEKVVQGAACVWVRNAVDDAIAAVEALHAAGVEADLLHARFALGDRKRIEAGVVGRFGKTGMGRAGRVVVATQVLESSMDLDFDVMVSDLAPMASLIQRAGRLWRHMQLRPYGSRPVQEPVLYVLSPDPACVEDARWMQDALDRGAYVYPQDVAWRTAERLFAAGRIVAPSGLRALIEAVEAGDAELPEPLQRAEIERIGKASAQANQGWRNTVELDNGYRMGGAAADDAEYPTRLGQPQRVLVLARRGGGQLLPWAEGVEGWALSEVTASAHRLDALPLPDQTAPEIQAVVADWPDWKRAVLCPVAEDGVICEGLRYEADRGLIFSG
ncbi:CRISPR-associated helicase Cas3' [Cypionkella sp.]|uniref:CRISPR-associated helicase Cas3' n=1 Tax=Cypionkella sp. TaxID=2811411 RepID=UPI002AC95A53|nr:CRISPR-associated helicase Cas3' [Cypionkella sp.]